MRKKKILLILTLPPPVHGSAVMSQYIKESKLINDSFDCDYINLSTSRKMDEIGVANPIKIWRFLTVLILLMWKLAIKRYDLCYLAITCHGIGFLKDTPFIILCKLFRKKIVIHQHNKGMHKDEDRWPYKWLLPLVYNNVKVILLSWRLYSDIERIVPKENVYICPNGIPEIDYEYIDRNNEIPHLLFLSNLIESKGVLVLLDALEILRGKGISVVCSFIGGETKEINRARFEKEVEKRNLQTIAIFEGRIYGSGKERYFAYADIFVFPSFYENETFGLVNLEAMAHRLPVVTTDEGGIPDVIEDGVNGLICKKKDAVSLASCIEKLIINEHLRKEMGKMGYQKFKTEYTLECFEERLSAILRNCFV